MDPFLSLCSEAGEEMVGGLVVAGTSEELPKGIKKEGGKSLVSKSE